MKSKTLMMMVLAATLAVTSALAGKPRVVVCGDDYVLGFATQAQLDACQKAEYELNEYLNNTDYSQLDPAKKADFEEKAKNAKNSEYCFPPDTKVKLLKQVKNGKYFDDCLVVNPFDPRGTAWVNAGDIFEQNGDPVQ